LWYLRGSPVAEDLRVCVVVVHDGGSPGVERCLGSLAAQTYHAGTEVHVLNQGLSGDKGYGKGVRVVHCPLFPRRTGGLVVDVLRVWAATDAAYLSVVSAESWCDRMRYQAQVDLLEAQGLSACYGDLARVDPETLRARYVERAKEFSPEMLGMNCFSLETTLLHRERFAKGGGFDHVFAAGHRPDVYLATMAALGGRVARLDQVVLYTVGKGRVFEEPFSDQGWTHVKSRQAWDKLRFEGFVARARAHLKGR
jgi:hypothetical protein